MKERTSAIAIAALAVVWELIWLLFAHGSIGWITAVVVIAIGVAVLTGGRYSPILLTVRILLGALLLGSVADRFGLFGGPGTEGVSWGGYSEFVDYTRTLLPDFADAAAPVAAASATALEAGLGFALILGIATRRTASASAALFAVFTVAMATSVGVSEMLSYAVPVMAAGAALIAVCHSHEPRRSIAALEGLRARQS